MTMQFTHDEPLELFPEVLEPIPPDLWARVSTPDQVAAWMQGADRWFDACEHDSAWDAYYLAVNWYEQRKLSTLPIVPSPSIWFLRVGDTIRVRWDNRDAIDDGIPIWSATVGEI